MTAATKTAQINTVEANAMWTPELVEHEDLPLRRRRIRGLRLTAVPSGSLVAQVAGGAAVLYGVYGQWGVHVAAIVAGVGAALLGALREAGKI